MMSLVACSSSFARRYGSKGVVAQVREEKERGVMVAVGACGIKKVI